MIETASIAIGILVVFFLGRMAFSTASLQSALDETRRTEDPTPVVEAIAEVDAEKRATKLDHAVGELWQAYARETAAEVVVESAEVTDATILQYWIRQVLEVEPEIASEVFDDEFLRTHYKPDVAARCGKSGCCG